MFSLPLNYKFNFQFVLPLFIEPYCGYNVSVFVRPLHIYFEQSGKSKSRQILSCPFCVVRVTDFCQAPRLHKRTETIFYHQVEALNIEIHALHKIRLLALLVFNPKPLKCVRTQKSVMRVTMESPIFFRHKRWKF